MTEREKQRKGATHYFIRGTIFPFSRLATYSGIYPTVNAGSGGVSVREIRLQRDREVEAEKTSCFKNQWDDPLKNGYVMKRV